jgi:hypothetical protein
MTKNPHELAIEAQAELDAIRQSWKDPAYRLAQAISDTTGEEFDMDRVKPLVDVAGPLVDDIAAWLQAAYRHGGKVELEMEETAREWREERKAREAIGPPSTTPF